MPVLIIEQLCIMKLVYITFNTWTQSQKHTPQGCIITEKKVKFPKQAVANLGDQEESLSLLVSVGGRIRTAFTPPTFLQDAQVNPSWQQGKLIRTADKPCSGMDRISRSALSEIRWGTILILLKHGFGWLRTLCLKITYVTSHRSNAFNPWLENLV